MAEWGPTLEPRAQFRDGRSQIHLIGFMGAGKSTVGQLVARSLLWNYLDLDALVVRHAGMSIREIFDTGGEAAFREVESHVLRQAILKPRTVVALGGGTWDIPTNRERASLRGLSVWIECPLDLIRARIGPIDRARPLWQDEAAVERRFERRAETYALADLRVDGSGSPLAVAGRVVDLLRDH